MDKLRSVILFILKGVSFIFRIAFTSIILILPSGVLVSGKMFIKWLMEEDNKDNNGTINESEKTKENVCAIVKNTKNGKSKTYRNKNRKFGGLF